MVMRTVANLMDDFLNNVILAGFTGTARGLLRPAIDAAMPMNTLPNVKYGQGSVKLGKDEWSTRARGVSRAVVNDWQVTRRQ